MKNNIVTTSQFCFLSFLSSLSALLFIDVSSSYQQIIYIGIATVINILVVLFYKGKNNSFIKTALFFYYIIVSVLVINKFVVFMNSAVKSGPYWILLIIITITIFFCSVKGFEALSRAAVIISFFVALFLLYIVMSTVKSLSVYEFTINSTTGILLALVLLFPSATYVSLGHKVAEHQKYPFFINFAFIFAILGYFIFISSPVSNVYPLYYIAKNSHLGIFKGAEFLLVTIVTIGVIFLVCNSICSIVESNSSKLYNGAVLLLIFLLSLFSLYFNSLKELLFSEKFQIIVALIMLIGVIFNSLYFSLGKNHKNCNKSKKS